MVKKLRRSSRPTKKILLATLVAILVLGSILFALEKAGITNLYSSNKSGDSEAKTTSTTKTAQEDFNDGEFREPGNSLNENEGTGSISDNNGTISEDTDTSNPVVSATGEITLYTPKSNASVNSGYVVAGTSTLSFVSYRLIDSVSGVISMGELRVVNDKFSGTLNFTTTADEGRLDIYGTKEDGSEFSSIEIPIRFNQ
jgi:hypothetical protein